MQTHNLKLPKNYRDAASDFYIKVGIGLIAVLIILNLLQLFLFLKETKNNKDALRILHETNKSLVSLQDSLDKMDMQKAFVYLADARGQIAAALPPAHVAPPAKAAGVPPTQPAQQAKAAVEPKDQTVRQPAAEQKASAMPAKKAEFTIPVGETPASLISAMAGEYALICEKESNLLHLFKFDDDRFVLAKSYPSIIGANGTITQPTIIK